MTEYYLRELEDGRTDLVEMTPAVIATFARRADAERYRDLLVADAAPEVPEPLKPAAALPEPAVASAPVGINVPSKEEWRQACVAIAAGSQMKEIADMLGVSFFQLRGKYGAWKRQQKAAAAGTTAEAPQPQQTPAEEPVEVDPEPEPAHEPREPHRPLLPALSAQTAISRSVSLIPLDLEPANCRLCDHPFNASACSDGLCARCLRDQGFR